MSLPQQAQVLGDALRTRFPALGIVVSERSNGHVLRCEVDRGEGPRTVFSSPPTVSAKNEAPEYWVHRFTMLLREHYKL